MAAITASGQHTVHSSMSFPEEDNLSNMPYPMDSDMDDSANTSIPFSAQPQDELSSSGPLPNPPFVFPARLSPSSAPSSFSRATGRRTLSTFDTQTGPTGFARDFQLGSGGRSAPPPLPSFSFNPAGLSLPDSGMASPPQSPLSPLSPLSPGGSRSIPSRPGGHRRGVSEFIGGDGKTGTGGLLSTSPTKGEASLPTPSSAGRRGHAHRRSAAISCHDLSTILKPTSPATSTFGGSAPTSPSEELNQLHFSTSLESALKPDVSAQTPPLDSAMVRPLDSPVRASKNTRVGFSDTLEFIPRPLSVVSSDTSSTATMRQGHSVSGSLSSLMSAGAASPPSKTQRSLPSPVSSLKSDDRPSTAGPVLGSTRSEDYFTEDISGEQRRNSTSSTVEHSVLIPDPPLTPKTPSKRYFFFGHESTPGDASPTRSRPASAGSSEKARSVSNTSASPLSDHHSADDIIPSVEELAEPVRKTSISRKTSKKQKKVKSWGSILSRKPRPRSQKQKALSRRSPTPPLRSYDPVMSSSQPSLLLDEHSLHDISQPVLSSRPSVQTDFANWKPRHVVSNDDDSMSPIIDLDAALGPFNTPSGHDSDWEMSQRGTGLKKRPMHSAAGMKGFNGPGMHYHRRTESAPEMLAFESPRFRLHHIGSSSTMEDVFEEDEEDDWEEVKTISHKGSRAKVADEDSSALGIEIKVVDSEVSNGTNAMDWTTDESNLWQRGLKRKKSGLSDGGRTQTSNSIQSERPVSPLREVTTSEDCAPEFTTQSFITRPISSSKSSTTSLTPELRPHPAKDLTLVETHSLTLQPPYLTPTSQHSTFHSPFPSPRSPMSYDPQRISTAPSSFTDEPHSLWLGEPGPELRMSVDDVPSLSSSGSTMTKESATNPGLGNPQFRAGQRSVSLSGPSVTRKRSSIASLSRLLSSHGEKSKLSIEEKAPESPEKKEKGKGKRLSRMMQFWRPKDV